MSQHQDDDKSVGSSQQLQMRERELALLKETVSAIISQLDLDTVFQLVADRALN